MDLEKKIAQIIEEIRKTPYHKGTEHYIGRLKAKLAKFKAQLERRVQKSGGGQSFALRKTGDASVVLIGFPSIGKSTLLTKITSAYSKSASYDFTTLTVIPGMMEYKGAKIQVFDVPGLIEGAAKGKGRGKEVISVARTTDLLLLMASVENLSQIEMIRKELHEAGIRIDRQPPQVLLKKKNRGGIRIIAPGGIKIPNSKTIKAVANEFGLVNAEIIIKEALSLDGLIDAFLGNRVYLPALIIINKIDLINVKKLNLPDEYILISTQKNIGLEELREAIWQKLGLIRVYLKAKDKEPDFSSPLIFRKKAVVLNVAEKVSTELTEGLKGAWVWGKSVRFPGQKVGKNHQLVDEDIVCLDLG